MPTYPVVHGLRRCMHQPRGEGTRIIYRPPSREASTFRITDGDSAELTPSTATGFARQSVALGGR